MSIKDTIDQLARTLRPVPRYDMQRRLALAIALAGLLALAYLVAMLGFRSDIHRAWMLPEVWIKMAYAGSLLVAGSHAVFRLARPTGEARASRYAVAACLVGITVLAAVEMGVATPDRRASLALGQTWRVCSALILLLAVPFMAALFLAMRHFAPIRLTEAGAAIGLASGAAATLVYTLHCPETGIAFIAVWYSAGIALSCMAGAALGSALLRWR